ncbi:MAG TPA: nuclear transport factor 2 family protein [Candidatus Angelobacter sp.]|nr:nuclear transport factor 2 family protein [Candidatus Angelobacter sp.]
MAIREPIRIDSRRTAKAVFEDHLALAAKGVVEEDLLRNYHEDCVILINSGEYRGHAGARRLADQLAREMPEAEFEYTTKLVSGRFAFLEWTGSSKTASVQDGADSFVIENGKIVAQTIHYTLIAN